MKKKVLQFVGALSNGGVENFVVNITTNLNKELFDIDIFIVSSSDDKYHYKTLIKNKINIIDFFPEKCKYKKYPKIELFKESLKILKKNNYDVVHIHVNNEMIPILLACKLAKIPIVCVHSHASYSPYWNPSMFSFKSKIMIKLQKVFISKIATHKLGCSRSACDRLYGKDNKATKVIFNGIDLKKFNVNKLSEFSECALDNKKINFVHIGRFNKEKNQKFLIEIWSNLIKLKQNIHLYIVGYGPLENEIRCEIEKRNLKDSITILPSDTYVPGVLSNMNYFLLPSLYEGLGIVLIEAQAMGITCFVSDTVPIESNLGLCKYISLEKSSNEWAQEIKYEIENNSQLKLDLDLLDKYNIINVAKSLEYIYGE